MATFGVDNDHGVKNKELSDEGTGFKKSRTKLLPGTSLASVESLSMPLVQEVVLSADIRCAECQKRVAEMISKLNETESVLVNVLEKKVTLTCRYPAVVKVSTRQVATIYRNPLGKIAMIKRIFRSSCT
ncbi:Heavy metal-associated domain containing protein [Melia azedarach]|uniref:Heavy metal-associated domain containing protein n=1 Tax=Melia azedarach TaxID=155640 RepID=A0ACC1XHW5_MELAZ|nr:Heavy metal-associated domain containing protein [Melia azedarach]